MQVAICTVQWPIVVYLLQVRKCYGISSILAPLIVFGLLNSILMTLWVVPILLQGNVLLTKKS